MPQIDVGDLTTLRQRPIVPPKKQYISIAPRQVVFSGRVSGNVYVDELTLANQAHANTSPSGSQGDTDFHMTVDYGTTAGARDIGSARLRKPITVDLPFTFLEEIAPAKLPIQSGDYFSVIKMFRPYIKLPYGEGIVGSNGYVNAILLRMDYDDLYLYQQNAQIVPKANITRSGTSLFAPKCAGFVDSGQSYRTVILSASKSFALATGASISSVLWDVDDGTISSGTASSTTITVQFPAGFRYIKLTVTDSNGKSSWMYYPIWAHDADNMPLANFHVTSDTTSGWREMGFEFFSQDTSEITIPKGTAICYWEEPDFHGEETPENYRDQFYGWSSEDTTIFRKYMSRTTLQVKGVAWWLSQFRGTSQRLSDPGRAPETWFEMEDITVDRVAYFVLQNMTTVNHISNLFLSGETDVLKSLDITLGSTWQQLTYIVSGYYGRIGADSLNGLWIRKHYSYMTSLERAAVDPIISLTSYDWTDERPIQIMRRYLEPNGYVRAGGASYNGNVNTLYASAAPGRTMYHGSGETEAPGQNLPTENAQDVLNHLTGAHYAYINNPRESVSLELLFNLDVIEPCWMEPVLISTSDSDSGLVLNNDEFLVKEVSITYDNPDEGRGKTVTYTLEGVTTGVPGQMVEVPEDVAQPPDRWDTTPEVVIPPSSGGTGRIPNWTNQMPVNGIILSYSEGKFARIVAFDPVGGTATYIENSTGLTGTGLWYRSDPYNYKRGFALMTTGLFKCEDISTNQPWTLVAGWGTIFGNSLRRPTDFLMSHMKRGWMMMPSGYSGAAVSFDYGQSWRIVAVNGGTAVLGSNLYREGVPSCCAVAICGHDAGHLYSVVQNATGQPWQYNVFRSIDSGLNWVQVNVGTSPDNGGGTYSGMEIQIPYARAGGAANVDDANLEITTISGNGLQHGLSQSYDRGESWLTIEREGPSGTRAPTHVNFGRSLHHFTHDADYLTHANDHPGNGAQPGSIKMYENYFTTPIIQNGEVLANGAARQLGFNGWSMNPYVGVTWWNLYGYAMTFDAYATAIQPALPAGWDDGIAYVEFSLYPYIPPA